MSDSFSSFNLLAVKSVWAEQNLCCAVCLKSKVIANKEPSRNECAGMCEEGSGPPARNCAFARLSREAVDSIRPLEIDPENLLVEEKMSEFVSFCRGSAIGAGTGPIQSGEEEKMIEIGIEKSLCYREDGKSFENK